MKITNNYGLPNWVFETIVAKETSTSPTKDRIRVTELISPPLERILKINNWDTIKKDAVEFLTVQFGTAWHEVHNNMSAAEENDMVEMRLEHKVGSVTLTGQFDHYVASKNQIRDIKLSNTRSFNPEKAKPEQIAQQNIYRWLLYKTHGIVVDSLVLDIFFRDWFITDADRKLKYKESTYPAIPYMEQQIPIWSFDEVEHYINGRMELHNNAFSVYENDSSYIRIECTEEEKWQEPEVWAVVKSIQGGKVRAFPKAAHFKSRKEALAWKIVNKPKEGMIERRLSIAKRCKMYCSMRNVCPYSNGPIIF